LKGIKSALEVAKSLGEDMRLLYIYGEAGMGNYRKFLFMERNKCI